MKNIVCIFLLIAVTVCWTQAAKARQALASSGPPSYFDAASLSEEERSWLDRFYKGSLFCDGWNEISRKILANTPAEARVEQKEMLEELGLKIGKEWARSNEVRRIDTEMLRSWGSELKKASSKGPMMISQVLAGINSQVDTLLN